MDKPPRKPMYKAIDKAQSNINGKIIDECETIEQIYKILQNYEFWRLLKKGFQNYFNGKQLFKGLKKEPEINKKVLEVSLFYFLRIYEILFFGWESIDGKIQRKFNIDCDNPGELLNIILCNLSKEWVQNKKLASQQSLYRYWNAVKCQDINTHQRHIEKQTLVFSDEQLEYSSKLIYFCIDEIKSSKSEVAKSLARNFDESYKNLINFMVKEFRKTF